MLATGDRAVRRPHTGNVDTLDGKAGLKLGRSVQLGMLQRHCAGNAQVGRLRSHARPLSYVHFLDRALPLPLTDSTSGSITRQRTCVRVETRLLADTTGVRDTTCNYRRSRYLIDQQASLHLTDSYVLVL